MLCTHCGTPLPDGSGQCHVCGTPQTTAWDTTPQDITQAIPDPWQPNTYTVPQTDPYTPKKEKKPLSPKAKRIIIISAVVLLLVAIGLFLWLEIFTVRVFVPTKVVAVDVDGDEQYRVDIKYDGKGNPTKITMYESEEMTGYAKREYDRKGFIKTLINYDEDGEETSRTEYDCNSKGNVTEEIDYNQDGDITSRTEYDYDSKGNRTKATSFYISEDGEETEGGYTEYDYDSKGNKTEARYFSSDGKLSSCTEYEYDKNGNCTLQVYYTYWNNEDGEESYRYERSYNKYNKITEELYYSDGSEDWERCTEYAYNGKKLTRISNYDENGDLYRYSKVKCDDNGNPTKEIVFTVDEDGEETETGTTTIKYKEFRMTMDKAKKLQEEIGNSTLVVIDEGWFPN